MSADRQDADDVRAAHARNRERMGDRFPPSGWRAPVGPKRVAAAVAAAAEQGVVLDGSAGDAVALERLVTSWEELARVASDLPAGARVADAVEGVIDLAALGAYYGELFVRHSGATWTEAEGEDGPEPAVARGGVVVLPLTLVRMRVRDGPPPDLAEQFATQSAAMAAAAPQEDNPGAAPDPAA